MGSRGHNRDSVTEALAEKLQAIGSALSFGPAPYPCDYANVRQQLGHSKCGDITFELFKVA